MSISPPFVSLQGHPVGPGWELQIQEGPRRNFTMGVSANTTHSPVSFTVRLEAYINSGGEDTWISLVETDDYGFFSVHDHIVPRVRATLVAQDKGSDPLAGLVVTIAVGED